MASVHLNAYAYSTEVDVRQRSAPDKCHAHPRMPVHTAQGWMYSNAVHQIRIAPNLSKMGRVELENALEMLAMAKQSLHSGL